MDEQYRQLHERMLEINNLAASASLLSWDQETCMPPRGVQARANQKGTLAAILHERLCAPQLGDLLNALQQKDLPAAPATNIREMRRERERAVKMPVELVRELTEVTSLAQHAWVKAREENDWEAFAPHLAKIVELKKREADAVGYEGEPYNALLDEYEPGARVEDLNPIFADLRESLTSLLTDIRSSDRVNDEDCLRQPFSVMRQDRFCRGILADVGFDFDAGRVDTSAHPFTDGIAIGDVRLTLHFDPEDLRAGLFAALHEGGHALYEQGLPSEYEGTPMATAVSLGIHESQSRLWENQVGRSREFLSGYQEKLRDAFPGQFDLVSVDAMYRAANMVRPGLIRIEADEVTYNLHIILRLELERGLVSGQLKVADLPGLWRERMQKYVGVEPTTDAEGVLQDIHWAFGLIGYFPTYTLGNLYAAQFFNQAASEIEDLPMLIEQRRFKPLLSWLREKIHRSGSLLTAGELCREVTGKDLSSEAFVNYLRRKFGAIYELQE